MAIRNIPYVVAQHCGARIRFLREQRHLTLKDMAARTGFTHQLLSKVELGGTNTPIETLARIAEALRVPLSAIVGMTEKETDHLDHPRDTAQVKTCAREVQETIERLTTVHATLVTLVVS